MFQQVIGQSKEKNIPSITNPIKDLLRPPSMFKQVKIIAANTNPKV
jgi:hypothetical protein